MPPRPSQLELLEWTPPAAVERFDEQRVRAVTLPARMCRAMAAALHDAALRKVKRTEIASCMSEYLGENVSVAMIDAYVSEARDTHVINLPRFIALVHATHDRRLLGLIAEMFGWAVIEQKYLPLIKVAQLREQEDRIKALRRAEEHEARRGGGL